MQPFRQTSLVQHPDGEIIRAVMNTSGSLPDVEDAIQFNLGMLGRQVVQEDSPQDPTDTGMALSASGKLQQLCRASSSSKF